MKSILSPRSWLSSRSSDRQQQQQQQQQSTPPAIIPRNKHGGSLSTFYDEEVFQDNCQKCGHDRTETNETTTAGAEDRYVAGLGTSLPGRNRRRPFLSSSAKFSPCGHDVASTGTAAGSRRPSAGNRPSSAGRAGTSQRPALLSSSSTFHDDVFEEVCGNDDRRGSSDSSDSSTSAASANTRKHSRRRDSPPAVVPLPPRTPSISSRHMTHRPAPPTPTTPTAIVSPFAAELRHPHNSDEDDLTEECYEYTYSDAVSRTALADELVRLSRRVWYWGPLSPDEAKEMLSSQPPGSYLVRESCNEQFYFTVSFCASDRRVYHCRIEYRYGQFFFLGQANDARFSTVDELVAHYDQHPYRGYFGSEHGRITVKLSLPLSRFAQIRSLQYLCHFVIRQHARVGAIKQLPLPVMLNKWLQQNEC